MKKHYLIFDRYAHSVIFFAQAETIAEAIWVFIANQDDDAVRQEDGSIKAGQRIYSHPLAYIETNYKANAGFEWQIRELPEWAWQDDFNEVFCGESGDGPGMVIDDCRKIFAREYPRSRAKAFVWYMQEGALVSFFRKSRHRSMIGSPSITILKRYFHNWDGKKLTVDEWSGDYDQLTESLKIEPPRWPWTVRT